MAAAVPRVAHEQEQVFAIAYVACRLRVAVWWRGTGSIMTAWPAAQAGAGLVPWIVSTWVPAPGRYYLWAIGVVADIAVSALQARDPGQVFARYRHWADEMKERYGDEPDRLRRMPDATEAAVDASHLGERLGLFVIIVLGEAVAQVVSVAADVEYGPAGTMSYGNRPPRITPPTHYLLTAGIVLIAAGRSAQAVT